VAIGVVIFMIGQSMINIGVNIGSLPTTGVTLPFFSYGGSSLVASFVLTALLVRIARENHEKNVISLTRNKTGNTRQRSLRVVK
jgi:cell division protein FtsW